MWGISLDVHIMNVLEIYLKLLVDSVLVRGSLEKGTFVAIGGRSLQNFANNQGAYVVLRNLPDSSIEDIKDKLWRGIISKDITQYVAISIIDVDDPTHDMGKISMIFYEGFSEKEQKAYCIPFVKEGRYITFEQEREWAYGDDFKLIGNLFKETSV